jgi:putative SbcD/Mre11-related phosphoesterase
MKHPTLPIFEGWQFTPEGAAVHHAERTAVIADLHLGYEWARGASGDCVVAHSLEETLARLSTLLGRSSVSQLIVAGDLLESARPCADTARDLAHLKSWLADRGVGFLVLEGNHDVAFSLSARRPSGASNRLPATFSVAGWTIGHGHQPIPGQKRICGHHHPVFRWQGIAAPCFVVSTDRIVLPAFSPNAAGCDVITSALPREWRAGSLRCLVSTGDDVLDFGPLAGLRRKLRHRVT